MSHGKIAIFLLAQGGGGAERAMISLAGRFRARGHAVDLVSATDRGKGLAPVQPDVEIRSFGHRHVVRYAPIVVAEIAGYLRREKPAALLSTLNLANVLALLGRRLAGTGTRVVLSEQVALSEGVAKGPRALRATMPFLTRRAYPWADAIIAVSRGVARDLARFAGLPEDRIHTIYNPVMFEEIAARAKEPLTHPWLAPGCPPVILGAGRLTGQKDFPTLFRAFALVRKETAARLIVLGEGEERQPLLELARELHIEEDLDLPGFTANPFAYMSRAAAFVLSSRFEGLPSVLLEAMACGCPVVSTDCPSGPDEILEGGRYGTLVPVADPASLAAAILRTLRRSGSHRPTQERLHAFEIEEVAASYLRLLCP